MNQSVRKPYSPSDTSRPEPTPKQAEVLDLMMDHLKARQQYPTFDEMSELLGITRNAVLERVELLVSKGWLERCEGSKARGYRIPGLVIGLHLSGQTWTRHPVQGDASP